jgi:ABC-type xylose transport system permease subunit
VFSALKIGLVLCLVGLIIAVIAVFIGPLIADRICELQPDILHNLQGGKDCAQVVAVGFLTILAVPGTLLLLVGSFIVVMAAINQISYIRLRNDIKNDWGGKFSDSRTRHIDK